MRTLLIPLAFLAVYAAALLSVGWLLTPGSSLFAVKRENCIAAAQMGFPVSMWQSLGPADIHKLTFEEEMDEPGGDENF